MQFLISRLESNQNKELCHWNPGRWIFIDVVPESGKIANKINKHKARTREYFKYWNTRIKIEVEYAVVDQKTFTNVDCELTDDNLTFVDRLCLQNC